MDLLVKRVILLLLLVCMGISCLEAQSRTKKRKKIPAQHGVLLGFDNVLYGAYPFNYVRPGVNIGYIVSIERHQFKSILSLVQKQNNDTVAASKLKQYRMKFQFDYLPIKLISIGYHIAPTYNFVDRVPKERIEYPTMDLSYKFGFGIDPAFYYRWKHFYMTLGLELPLYEVGHYRFKELNPHVPVRQQLQIGNEVRFLQREIKYYFQISYLF